MTAHHGDADLIDTIGRTAFITAQWRFEESRRPGRLFDDSLAACFLDDQSRGLAERLGAVLPEAPRMIVLRTRWVDDCLTEWIPHVAQVVVLGAGFDTRRLRCATGDVAWFEVDRPALLDFKRARLARCGLDARATYVGCDYVRDDFAGALTAAGLDVRLPTYVVWEGNTFFLPMDDVVSVLLRMRRSFERFSVSFDFMSQAVVERSTGHPGISRFADVYASLGADFVTGIADLDSFTRDLGLEVADRRSASDLARQHAAREPAAMDAERLPLFEHYFLATLRRAPG